MLPNAAVFEMVQFLLALLGISIAFWRLWVAIQNSLAVTCFAGSDLRRIIAETQIIGELFRLFAQGCLAAMGMISILLPPPGGPAATDLSLQGVLIRFGLMTLTLVMVADSLIQEMRRRQFLEVASKDGIKRRSTDQVHAGPSSDDRKVKS